MNNSINININPQNQVNPQHQVNQAKGQVDLSEWEVVDTRKLPDATQKEIRRAAVAHGDMDAEITKTAKSARNLRIFLNCITLGIYSAVSPESTATQDKLLGSFARDDEGLMQMELDSHKEDIEELSLGKELELININKYCKDKVETFVSGYYGEDYGRERSPEEESAARLMETVKAAVKEFLGHDITDEWLETICCNKTNRQTLVGFAQLYLLQRPGSLGTEPKDTLVVRALVSAFKHILKLEVGAPKPLAPLKELIPADARDILNDANAKSLLTRVYGEMENVKGVRSPYGLTNDQRKAAVVRLARTLKRAVANMPDNSSKRADILEGIVKSVTASDEAFGSFMKGCVIKDAIASNGNAVWLVCCQLERQYGLCQKVAAIKNDLDAMITSPENVGKPNFDRAKTLVDSLKDFKLTWPMSFMAAEELNKVKFAQFQSEKVKMMLDGDSEDWDDEAIQKEALLRCFDFAADSDYRNEWFFVMCKDERYKPLIEKIIGTALSGFLKAGDDGAFADLSTPEKFNEFVNSYTDGLKGIGVKFLSLYRLTPDQAEKLAKLDNLDLFAAVQELTADLEKLPPNLEKLPPARRLRTVSGEKYKKGMFYGEFRDAVGFLAKFADAPELNASDGGSWLLKQSKAVDAMTPEDLGVVDTINESEAFASLFEKMRNTYAYELTRGGEEGKESFRTAFTELCTTVDTIVKHINKTRTGQGLEAEDEGKLRKAIVDNLLSQHLDGEKGKVATVLKTNYEKLFGEIDPKQANQKQGEQKPQDLTSQLNARLKTLRELAGQLGYGEDDVSSLFNEMCSEGEFDVNRVHLLSSSCVGNAEKIIRKLDARIALLQDVEELRRSHQNVVAGVKQEGPDSYELFLKAAMDVIMTTRFGSVFKSKEDVDDFVKKAVSALPVEDKRMLEKEVEKWTSYDNMDVDMARQKVIHLVLHACEICYGTFNDPEVALSLGKHEKQHGEDEYTVFAHAMTRRFLSPHQEKIRKFITNTGIPHDKLKSENAFDCYSEGRKTKMDRKLGKQDDNSNSAMRKLAVFVCRDIMLGLQG